MASWILLGILIGLTLASISVLCWQLVQVLLDLRQILGLVKDLTKDVKPALQDVNEILHKSNLAMEEAGNTYQALGENAREAMTYLGKLKAGARHAFLVAKAGVEKGVEVFREGGSADDDFAPAQSNLATEALEKS
jgi:predicted PurR-regulated permease PerM